MIWTNNEEVIHENLTDREVFEKSRNPKVRFLKNSFANKLLSSRRFQWCLILVIWTNNKEVINENLTDRDVFEKSRNPKARFLKNYFAIKLLSSRRFQWCLIFVIWTNNKEVINENLTDRDVFEKSRNPKVRFLKNSFAIKLLSSRRFQWCLILVIWTINEEVINENRTDRQVFEKSRNPKERFLKNSYVIKLLSSRRFQWCLILVIWTNNEEVINENLTDRQTDRRTDRRTRQMTLIFIKHV